MTNPVAVLRSFDNQQGIFQYEEVWTWCPGCQQIHPFRIKLGPSAALRQDGTKPPVWSWDGNLEKPTFSPSLLCYYTIHLCENEHTFNVCEDPQCPSISHRLYFFVDGEYVKSRYDERVMADTPRVKVHESPHTKDPVWGNCHSFLREGVWQFLGDSAHELAGQNVPMVPLPDWIME